MTEHSPEATSGPPQIDQSGWSTSGSNSPMAGRDQQNHTYNYYGLTEGGRRTDVIFGSTTPSSVTTEKLSVLSIASNLATIIALVWTIITTMVQLGADAGVEPPGLFERLVSLAGNTWIPCAAMAVLLAITIALWRYRAARKRRWPIFYRRLSLRRPLVPRRSGGFVRARVAAECVTCKEENRPGVYGRLYRTRSDRDGIVTYRCQNKHVSKFRSRSVFAE
ncbi:hypothetical protein ACUOFU_05210 [Microbacterium arabinogalactanolyticum]|uniref:hypothetical protein n=1 Tax=Microbacterium arabinogalactanolyticum TaxID=69365 RepID=UPI00404452EF